MLSKNKKALAVEILTNFLIKILIMAFRNELKVNKLGKIYCLLFEEQN